MNYLNQIQIKAMPTVNGVNGNRKGKRLSQVDLNTYKGVSMPPRIPYEPTIKDKMCFKAITFMKVKKHFFFIYNEFFLFCTTFPVIIYHISTHMIIFCRKTVFCILINNVCL